MCLSVLLDFFSYYYRSTAVETITICILLLKQFVQHVIFYRWGNLRTVHDNMNNFLATTLNRFSAVC